MLPASHCANSAFIDNKIHGMEVAVIVHKLNIRTLLHLYYAFAKYLRFADLKTVVYKNVFVIYY